MRFNLTGIEPVAIALDRIEVEGGVRFTGLDLDSGAQVVVAIERSDAAGALIGETFDVSGLVLVLSLGRASREA